MIDKKLYTSYLYFTLIVLCSMSVLSKASYADDDFILAVHPYLSEEELVKKFAPIASYLSKRLGKTVKVKIGSNYGEHIQYIGLDKVDIAYMGPASYVNMVHDFGDKPILARLEVEGKSWFQGNIIVREADGIKTLADIKGKRVAFGDPNSTMSYIVPHYMMHKAGIFINSVSRHQFLYSHNNVALGVLSGDFDAGAVKPAVFKKFADAGLRTIAKTPKISEHLFVTRADLPIKQIELLRSIMINMKESDEGLDALHAIKGSITGLVEANSGHYNNLRKIIIDSKGIH